MQDAAQVRLRQMECEYDDMERDCQLYKQNEVLEWKREDVPVDEPLKTTDLVLDCTELECQMELNVMTSDEKDMLIKHLLSQVKECQEQIDTIAEFGEQMACDLVQAQETDRESFAMYRTEMEQRVYDLTHGNPKIEHLQEDLKIAKSKQRYTQKQLQFAVLKLHRHEKENVH